MNKLITTTVIATLYASTTLAGSAEYEAPANIALAPAATDWSGFYAGGLAGVASGTQTDHFEFDWDTGGNTEYDWENDIEGNMYGAFAGVNFQSGAMVFGVEAAYSMGSVGYYDDDVSYPSYSVAGVIRDTMDDSSGSWASEFGGEFTSFIDLKARLGFAAGDALIYGFSGWSFGEYEYEALFGRGPASFLAISTSGMNYGAGVDYLVTDNFFMGLEVIFREQAASVVEGTSICCDADYTWDMSATIQEVELRGGWKF